ncbi:MAG: glycosyltransferase family 1 protein [Gemmatimonadetes bacterium]|nr:glycosyltransferase family 1 protein [Gemmatimonadota bacterium]
MIPVAFDLRDPTRSGIARVAQSLARAFAQRTDTDRRFDLTICGPLDQLQQLGAAGWSTRDIRFIDWPGGRYSAESQVAWRSVRQRVGDALWYFPHWDVPWYSLPERYVVTVFDLILVNVPGATTPMRRAVAARWIRRAVNGASRVVVAADHAASELAAFAPASASKIRKVPAGVDATFFEQAPALPPEIQAFADAGPFMLSVGNRKRHKNLSIGVDVLTRVPGVRWIVVGEAFSEWSEVERRANEAGVASRMLVLGQQPDGVLRALYRAAACVFFPSRAEGYGLPVIEAIAAGTPVVCSNAGSLPEVAGDCATLCDPDDVAGFAKAVERAIAQPRQTDPCLARVRAMTWSASAERLAAVLAEVA